MESARQAIDVLIQTLFRRDYSDQSTVQYQNRQIYIADVEFQIMRFSSLYQFCLNQDFEFPCIRISESDEFPIPIDFALSDFLGRKFIPNGMLPMKYILSLLHDSPMANQVKIIPAQPKNVVRLFRGRLTDFLFSRFKSRSVDPAIQSGIPFKVYAQKNGYRVHYSPAYFYNMSNVFGAPTSPVIGYIYPGKYIFGVQGPRDILPIIDPATFDIPPLSEAHLVVP